MELLPGSDLQFDMADSLFDCLSLTSGALEVVLKVVAIGGVADIQPLYWVYNV